MHIHTLEIRLCEVINVRSDIRRLIRIYDYLKWGKQKSFLTKATVNRHRTENPF